ncbi:MICOS complex subunit MIC19 [Bagarius yarrelli]|uniref:MICOS complex subunit MIC19 n=1 Tax=Bagarius yarrelli TaxID=175774 RepID=A0A556U409_BAGYA|nr:MICOS complex subunit MIC19 [Bagarius yarrelli]
MGGSSSSSIHIPLESEDAEGIVLLKGIRLTDRVVDRMKETPSAQDPQSNSSTYSPVTQPVTPQSKTLTPTETSALKLPHPPSYASALVPPPPPPLQESINPLVSKSASASMHSVQKHEVASTSAKSVPPVPPAEPLTITISPVTEPVAVPPPAETVPVVLSPPAEAVAISAPPSTITDTVTTSSPTELKAKPIESSTMALNGDVLSAPSVKAIHLPAPDETIDIPVESSFLSTPDESSPVEHAKLSITPTSEPVAEIELPLLFDTKPPNSIESVKISKDKPTSAVKSSDLSNNLEELLSAVPLPCEDFSVKQVLCPPTEDTPATRPVVEPPNAPVLASLVKTLGPLTFPQDVVKEEYLRKLISEELQKRLQEEKKMAELKIQQQLEEEKAKAEAEAQAKAQQQIQAEVEKMLKKEQLALLQSFKDVIIQKHKNIQDEQLLCQYYKQIQKLEKKERDLVKQDLMYKEQLAKLEQKAAKFTRVTSESFRKGLEETHKRFK